VVWFRGARPVAVSEARGGRVVRSSIREMAEAKVVAAGDAVAGRGWLHASSSLLLASLELSDTKVHEPEIRALLGTR